MGLLKSFVISFAALATLSAAITNPAASGNQLAPARIQDIQDQLARLIESGKQTEADSGWEFFDETAPTTNEHQRRGHHHHRKPVLVGDGSPIQRRMFVDLSYQTPCNHCHLGSSKFTVPSWIITGDTMSTYDRPDWTSGGFEVERNFNRERRYGYCDGDGGEYCTFWEVAFTEYTVQYPDEGKHFKIRSPNKGNAGGHGPFCVPVKDGFCQGPGWFMWDSQPTSNRPGAPS